MLPTPIDTPKHNFKNFNEARRWAKENIVGTYKNQDTGEDIRVSGTTIGKYLSEKAVIKSVSIDAHLSALRVLPNLVETAVLQEITPDKKNNPDVIEIQRFYGVIMYENSNYPVKLTIKVVVNEGKRAYSYEVLQIENPKA